MKRTWDKEEKIAILKEAETEGVVEACRKRGIYATTYYDWKKKYDSEGASALEPGFKKKENRDLKKVVKENEFLKKVLLEKELEIQVKTELLKKKIQQWKNLKR
jgi:transposase-like protein